MNKHYPTSSFTWGYELELGDIDRTLKVPEELGKWEYAETDIVNLHGKYRGIACDPLGLEPPVGGEINIRPTKTWPEQVERIMQVIQLFESHGNTPSASCVNHGHLHVRVPGLKEDPHALKRLISYIKNNQALAVEKCYQFKDDPNMRKAPGAKMYLKLDGGRLMPNWMCDNIIDNTRDFDSFILQHCTGKDAVSRGRPFRYAINTYCMKHTGTIEFRLFRASIERKHIKDQFKFCEQFIDAAINGGPSVEQILSSYDFEFPPFEYDHEMYLGWEKTKYDKSRGKKVREYIEA